MESNSKEQMLVAVSFSVLNSRSTVSFSEYLKFSQLVSGKHCTWKNTTYPHIGQLELLVTLRQLELLVTLLKLTLNAILKNEMERLR